MFKNFLRLRNFAENFLHIWNRFALALFFLIIHLCDVMIK